VRGQVHMAPLRKQLVDQRLRATMQRPRERLLRLLLINEGGIGQHFPELSEIGGARARMLVVVHERHARQVATECVTLVTPYDGDIDRIEVFPRGRIDAKYLVIDEQIMVAKNRWNSLRFEQVHFPGALQRNSSRCSGNTPVCCR
jgi:hypothetical protein